MDRIIRPAEACVVLGISKATLWRMVKRREIRPPLRVSRGAVGWRSTTIDRFLDERDKAAPESQ